MDSGVPLLSTEATAESTVIGRRRPLITFGISAFTIARIFYTKLQDFSAPIGLITRKIVACFSFAFPIISTVRNQSLALLSFADDHILVVENMIESVFPLSAFLFNKIDKLVLVVEVLPGKFDDALDKFPLILQKYPFLNPIISWLDLMISRLTCFDSSNTNEKQIAIDVNFNNPNIDKYEAGNSIRVSFDSPYQGMTCGTDVDKSSFRSYCPSYKEILEKGTKDIKKLKEGRNVEENRGTTACEDSSPDDTIFKSKKQAGT